MTQHTAHQWLLTGWSNQHCTDIPAAPNAKNPAARLNDALDTISVPHMVNETLVENILRQLEPPGATNPALYWLLTARVAEIALISAGHYIDHLEFEAAGDLLFNPRQVLVYQKGKAQATPKRRHMALSQQFETISGCDAQLSARWLRNNVSVAITKPALLPQLVLKMEQSGFISDAYLNLVTSRLKRAADGIGFLSALHLSTYEELLDYIETAHADTRRLIANNLCRFDTALFQRMGEDVRRLSSDPNRSSPFLRTSPSALAKLPGDHHQSAMACGDFR